MSRRLRSPSFSRRGFTLVEVVIAATISLLAITAVLSVFIASSKMIVESALRNRAAMQARQVIDVLSSDIRAATDVEASFGGYTADANTLILKLPAIDSNGFPVDIDNEFDRIVYHPGKDDSTQLVRTVIADADSSRQSHDKTLGRGADNKIGLSGTYQALPDALGAYVIYYSFSAKQESGSFSYENPIAGSVRLRNRV